MIVDRDVEPPSQAHAVSHAAGVVARSLSLARMASDMHIIIAYTGLRIAATLEEHLPGSTVLAEPFHARSEALSLLLSLGSEVTNIETDLEIRHLLPPRQVGDGLFFAWSIRKR